MEMTFDIDEKIVDLLRTEADRCGETMSALVESALLNALPQHPANPPDEPDDSAHKPLPPLPTWRAEFLVDVSNREELYRVLDDNPKFKKLYGFTPNSAPKEEE